MIRRTSHPCRGFTLIELMAVILVILVLAVIGFGAAGYVQKRAAIATTRAQLAVLEAALESYRSDWGYYPVTSARRISSNGTAELTNNACLYRALFEGGRKYVNFPAAQVYTNQMSAYVAGATLNIFDVYGKPFNYYCSPGTSFATLLDYTEGGQVNVAGYDLFSYGPDRLTFASSTATNWALVSYLSVWANPAYAADDITNWGP